MIDVAYDASRRADLRRGLTMIELLITMSIVAILASMVLFAMSTAQESARAARTEATIATLHALVMEQYESYRTRRLPINTSGMNPDVAANARLKALRELMRREMPDRWSDVNLLETTVPATALMQAYQRYRNAIGPDTQHQDAECLYMLITLSNPEARSLFSENQIGDTDGDGAPEFLDGWGRPIGFIRWPAGFDSDLQPLKADPNNAEAMIGDPDNDHDPFDPLRRDNTAYRLVPLIFSAGPDREYNILLNPPSAEGEFAFPVASQGWLDPYATVGTTGRRLGDRASTSSSGHIDNIHNHLIGAR